MKTTAAAGLVLVIAVAITRPCVTPHKVREAGLPKSQSHALVEPSLPSIDVPEPARNPVDTTIDDVLACDSVPDLVARLTDSPDAVSMAAIIALGRTGDPDAIPALLLEVAPARPFHAAQALQSIHAIDRGDLAARLARELLRSPELLDPDPVYHAAAVVSGVRIDDVVAELADGGSSHARQWMEQRKQSLNMPPCGKEHP